MFFRIFSNQLVSFCIIFFLFIKFTYAGQLINTNLIEFSLSLQNQTTLFNFTNKNHQVEIDQLGVNWYEPFSETFQGGLEFGYLDVTQRDSSLTSAEFSSGEYYGILLRFLPINTSFATLRLNLNYRYNKTESINTAQNLEFMWGETLISSELEFHPFDKLGLLLAAEYQNLSGEQHDFGNVLQIVDFTTSKNAGYRLGIHFKPDPTANIGLQWITGYKEGVRIHFMRRF